MNITIKDRVELNQRGRRSKYRSVYFEIEMLAVGKTFVIECDSIRKVGAENTDGCMQELKRWKSAKCYLLN